MSLLVATAAFFLVGRLLGPGIAGLPGRRRQQGLFTQAGEGEQLEFGYCFDVSGGTDRLWKSERKTGTVLTRLDCEGCDTSVLSGLGVAVRYAVHPLAADIEGQLVSIKTSVLRYSTADIALFSGYPCSSAIPCTS